MSSASIMAALLHWRHCSPQRGAALHARRSIVATSVLAAQRRKLREIERPFLISLGDALQPRFTICNGHRGVGNRGVRRVGDLSENGCGCFSLSGCLLNSNTI